MSWCCWLWNQRRRVRGEVLFQEKQAGFSFGASVLQSLQFPVLLTLYRSVEESTSIREKYEFVL
jgi:hypothetical protein